jgi:hypothetical protein
MSCFVTVSTAALLLAVMGNLPVDGCDSLSNADCCTATISEGEVSENELKQLDDTGVELTVGTNDPLNTTKDFSLSVTVTFKREVPKVPESNARFGIVMVTTDPNGVSRQLGGLVLQQRLNQSIS